MPLTPTTVAITAATVRDMTGEYRLETLTVGALGPRDVLVRIAGVGMCHTDLAVSGPDGQPFLPAVFGHEGAGVVEAVGDAVGRVAVGDHVVLSYNHCGTCPRCLAGEPYFCRTWQDLNTSPVQSLERASLTDRTGQPVFGNWFGQSSFASHALASENSVVVVPDDVPLRLVGPLGCGLMTGAGAVVNSLGVQAGDSLVIFGAGAVGMAALLAARICQAGKVIAVDPVESRRKLALELGATHALAGGSDLLAEIRELTGGGAHFAFDTSGRPEVVDVAVAGLRPGGVCGLVAIGARLEIDPEALVFGRTVKGTLLGEAVPQQFIPKMIEWWRRGDFPFERLIEEFPLSEINAAAEASRNGRAIKPVLVP